MRFDTFAFPSAPDGVMKDGPAGHLEIAISLRNGGNKMNQRAFCWSASAIFFLIALLHLLRLVFRWQAILEGWVLPLWVSWVPVLFFAYLAFEGFRLGKKV